MIYFTWTEADVLWDSFLQKPVRDFTGEDLLCFPLCLVDVKLAGYHHTPISTHAGVPDWYWPGSPLNLRVEAWTEAEESLWLWLITGGQSQFYWRVHWMRDKQNINELFSLRWVNGETWNQLSLNKELFSPIILVIFLEPFSEKPWFTEQLKRVPFFQCFAGTDNFLLTEWGPGPSGSSTYCFSGMLSLPAWKVM